MPKYRPMWSAIWPPLLSPASPIRTGCFSASSSGLSMWATSTPASPGRISPSPRASAPQPTSSATGPTSLPTPCWSGPRSGSGRGHAVEPWFSRVFDKGAQQWRLNEQLTAKVVQGGGLPAAARPRRPAAQRRGDSATLEQADHWLAQADKLHGKGGRRHLAPEDCHAPAGAESR